MLLNGEMTDKIIHSAPSVINPKTVRARGYKTFFILNSIEHEIFPANKY